MTPITLASGAELRIRNPDQPTRAVLLIGGGSGKEEPGVWSASTEYLARRLAAQRPDLAFAELRYRVRSWRQIEMCIDDGRAAIGHLTGCGAQTIVLVGYSLGGAVATQIADDARVGAVIGLAPWLPEALPATPMRGRELHVLHGTLDPLLGTPGVSHRSSREGFERIVAAGASGTYELISGAIHPIALRAPWGTPIGMPRARTWLARTAQRLELLAARQETA